MIGSKTLLIPPKLGLLDNIVLKWRNIAGLFSDKLEHINIFFG